jgi:DoxX-like protein
MNVAAVAVVLVTALVNGAVAVGDFLCAQFVLATSEQVRVPGAWLPALGAAKMAGAVGLVVGLLGVRVVGVAAATGLVLFFVCAIAPHVQTGVLRTIPFPGAFLVLAATALLVFVHG